MLMSGLLLIESDAVLPPAELSVPESLLVGFMRELGAGQKGIRERGCPYLQPV
jgi:hypothetical protein